MRKCMTLTMSLTLVGILVVLKMSLLLRHREAWSYHLSGEGFLYKLDPTWPHYPEHFSGQVFATAVDGATGRVYVAQRGDNVPKMLVFSESGSFLGSWNSSALEMPHGIFFLQSANNSNIWVTDVGTGEWGHSIKRFSPDGNLLEVLGTPGKAGASFTPLQFDQPAEVIVGPRGEMYVADGDGGLNNRVFKLQSDRTLEWVHGEKGSGKAQFYIPHSLCLDSFGRLWVADRGNKRIQVFDAATGEWLGEWTSCFTDDGPYSVRLTQDGQYLVVAQLNVGRLLLLHMPSVGLPGTCRVAASLQMGPETRPHLVSVSPATGAIYLAEIGAEQAQKFVPIR
ncbi:NHL repeat-containing protein 3 [Lethenteron reissneri]|uniref:NHL repeat-containing protein 3 n=1 Tax=Lethenteron reissneri TaxID=7753 RepID=UPI002AB6387B|nr:NHL repeat-containing protein 3 [Lethenteron reissneri]XP_061431489.1 NHL repeat-containing protein 3 [Lethenteron reissneri]XP_061431490.1 NHL repeat-containing protein 3 [Lethenteron reissneri]XP_061431491.1 NHL repeat-containing protein 3 [Lethenteron reissneri]XP_061431492.1 NHL repeat-containing protein 3 [Lethenteron reissneri]XP_061431493.1 NHL repeat-containing protein 3 [Lethenteron reissneri]